MIKDILKEILEEKMSAHEEEGEDKVEMPKDDYIAEHKKLINTIKSKDEDKLDEEKEEQKQEVKEKTGIELNGDSEEDDDEEEKPGQRGLLKLAVLMMKKKKK